MQSYDISRKGAVTSIISDDSEFRIFVTSDVHFDSAHCNRDQFFKDLDFAIKLDADIYINGDFFDAMQGRFDKRKDMDHLRPEYRREDYYDVIVNDAARFLEPYAHKIIMISDGNHELSVLKYANTNLLPRLLQLLKTEDHTILHGGYGGIINIKYDNVVCPIKYFHGSGGEAPVTKGAIQTNRQGVFLADFQVVLNGHSHNSYWIPLVRERITDSGTHYFDIQHHVRTPGYKMDYGDGTVGWDVTRGGNPKPTGGALLHFSDSEVHIYPKIHAPIPISPIEDIYQGIIFPQE